MLFGLIYVRFLEFSWKWETNRVALKIYRPLADKNDKVLRMFIPQVLKLR